MLYYIDGRQAICDEIAYGIYFTLHSFSWIVLGRKDNATYTTNDHYVAEVCRKRVYQTYRRISLRNYGFYIEANPFSATVKSYFIELN